MIVQGNENMAKAFEVGLQLWENRNDAKKTAIYYTVCEQRYSVHA